MTLTDEMAKSFPLGEMTVRAGYPPIIETIWHFLPGSKGQDNVLYCWGDIIYSPSGHLSIPPKLRVHEGIHRIQQHKHKQGTDGWWLEYLQDEQFRFFQEMQAYKAQYDFVAKFYGRKERRDELRRITKSILSPIYGWSIPFPAGEIKQLLTADAGSLL